MNELTQTTENQTPEEPEQAGKESLDPTRLSEAEYTSLREWLEKHYPPLQLSKNLSSLLSRKDQKATLQGCQAPLLDWLSEIYAEFEDPFHDCPTPLRDWLLTQEQIGGPSADPETQSTHSLFMDMLLRLIRSLEIDITREYEKDHGGNPPSPMKYACDNCGHDLWLRENVPWVCYWCKHRVLRKVKR